MHDQTLLLIILGVVAIAMIVQAVALAGALLAVRRLEVRFEKAESELRALQPRIERLGRVIDNLSEWTDSAAEGIPRVVKRVERTIDGFRNAARTGAMVLSKPLRPLGAALALWKGLASAARHYRSRRPAQTAADSPWVSAYETPSVR